ncbi:hypothetical protein DMUE_3567 [Dictyocoela muelleri]|nr:hypothetical protein DMUE_3567 [Dictyocoela muelleri]
MPFSFERSESEQKHHEFTTTTGRSSIRKKRQLITLDSIKLFLSLLNSEIALTDMPELLNLSYKTIMRLYKRFFIGDLQNLETYKKAFEKRGWCREGFLI